MTCAEIERTCAYIDGELPAAASAAAERHLAQCADCQSLCTTSTELRDALRRPEARHAPPAWLRARLGRALDAEAAKFAPPNRKPGFWVGALGGAGASAMAAAAALVVSTPPSAQTLATAIGDAHVRALMQGRMIEVVSTSHHTVKPWFAGRVPLSPPVVDLAADGFALVGGRVDRVAGAPAAVVAYRHGAHEIDLYVWPGRGAPPPNSAVRRGYALRMWRAGDLDFAAVSDVQPSELDRFVALVRRVRE